MKTNVAEIMLKARSFGQVFQTKHTSNLQAVGTSHWNHIYEIPEKLAAKTDVEMQATTDVAASSISAGFDIILVDD